MAQQEPSTDRVTITVIRGACVFSGDGSILSRFQKGLPVLTPSREEASGCSAQEGDAAQETPGFPPGRGAGFGSAASHSVEFG